MFGEARRELGTKLNGAKLATIFPEAEVSLTVMGRPDFTLSPEGAQTMHYMGRITRSPTIPTVTIDELNSGGFQNVVVAG